jgi:hypothetical protein
VCLGSVDYEGCGRKPWRLDVQQEASGWSILRPGSLLAAGFRLRLLAEQRYSV